MNRRGWRWGIEFQPPGRDGHVVLSVAPDSPAAVAGIRDGDRLVQLDGRDATGLTLADIKARLSRDGTRCTLQMRRSGATRTVTVRLKDRL